MPFRMQTPQMTPNSIAGMNINDTIVAENSEVAISTNIMVNAGNISTLGDHTGGVLVSGIPRFDQFLQRVSIACYAERCTSYSKSVRPSVRLSVRHTLALCQNDSTYDHAVFTGG